ncbi:Ti-type conjugative transfer relaxase TraA, partial [Agrobacterium tumefaciens]|nr:Ti-type conjugative transfer relaxase TraA [Agrobacterium tumefaciens]
GAKLVLVGDHEQLQAIGAGSPFRAIAERIGSVELTDIRRQKHDWQREASVAFATHRTADGLQQYAERNSIRFANDREQACADLIRDYVADRAQNPEGSRIALAHRRIDVRAINDGIRERLQAEGLLAKSDGQARSEQGYGEGRTNRERVYQTVNGERAFAPGDRIVLLENNRDLDVKNGMLGTVEAVEPNALHLRLDGSSGGSNNVRHLALP